MKSDFIKGIILAINPSHNGPGENCLWTQIAQEARRKNFLLVQIANRNIPFTFQALTICIPDRLRDINRHLGDIRIPKGFFSKYRWIKNEDVKIWIEWERRRWQIFENDHNNEEAILRMAIFADLVINTLNPSVVITMNKIEHFLDIFRKAAHAKDIKTLFIERGPTEEGILLEEQGMFAESKIWNIYNNKKEIIQNNSEYFKKFGERASKKMIQNPS